MNVMSAGWRRVREAPRALVFYARACRACCMRIPAWQAFKPPPRHLRVLFHRPRQAGEAARKLECLHR